MIELSSEMATIVLSGAVLVAILLGYPLFLSLGGVALVIGLLTFGPGVPQLFYSRIIGFVSDFILLAVPLFVFMGVMIERSGIAERLFNALYLWLGRLRGGLAVITILIGTIMAATVGIIAASVIMLGVIALPAMLKRGYSKDLACGAVCAGGTLGILIPPSIMLVVYGPNASISVGQLFMAAFIPGLMLSALYMTYIIIHSALVPKVGPAIPVEEARVSFTRKVNLLITSILPPLTLILAVLGSIFFGIASPTEAAAVGALASMALSAVYRTLTWDSLKKAVFETLRITGLVAGIAAGGSMFTAMFLGLGGGDVVTDLVLATPGGKWGVFAVIMFIIILLGMLIDWIGIVFIMIPVISPIVPQLGFDPLWFAMMVIINLQMSFMTPPFAPAIFVLQGVLKPEWGVSSGNIMRGVIPFISVVIVALILFIKFPQIILWLPSIMINN